MKFTSEIIQFILTLSEDDVMLLLGSILDDSLRKDEKEIVSISFSGKNKNAIINKIKVSIEQHGYDTEKGVKAIEKDVYKILSSAGTIETPSLETEVDKIGNNFDFNEDERIKKRREAVEDVKKIEEGTFLNNLELEALFRLEDPANPTPLLSGMTERAKWNFFILASTKQRILKNLS